MIQVTGLTKKFDSFLALDSLNLNVRKGSIYGLVGVNGSGKTTLIRHLTGIYRQDKGTVAIDGENVYDNAGIKARVGYIPDDIWFFPNYSMKMYSGFCGRLYKNWDARRYQALLASFGLNENARMSKFSKGMQKQAAFTFVMSAMPDVMILDEPIDGLDPVVRRIVTQKIVEDVSEREMTVLISSHNLKEMEGICDSIGILRQGQMAIERDLDELKSDVHKVQAAYPPDVPPGMEKYGGLNILHMESRGSVEIFVVRAKEEELRARLGAFNPLVFDLLPLSLEEIFIYEMEGEYDEIPV
ncbi:MAG: ABC transporter ATP-binding protein [Defluviitaleaceae bacterium]|nr:ABC transporter ATP-binding protein [Defluviitaleaceae bacterium]